MAKKDFSTIGAQKVKSTIEQATQEMQPAQENRKTRRTYTEQEAQEFLNAMNTTGRKGLKLPRINVAFAPDLYDYIRTMARAAGMNYTDFINTVLRQHMEENGDKYKRAIEFRNSL